MAMQVGNSMWQLAVASFVCAWASPLMAVGWPAEYSNKPLPAYESGPDECYVLLKPLGEYVMSSKAPVCTAVLENLNRFCGEPAQLDRRKIHPSARISEPDWVSIDPLDNFDAVKHAFLAGFLPQSRDQTWSLEEARVRSLAQQGVLQLAKADLRGIAKNLRGGVQAVYRLDSAGDPSGMGQNQSRLTFVPGENTAPEVLGPLDDDRMADLWIFDNELFLVRYLHRPTPIHRLFVVSEVIRPRLGPIAPIGATERCAIQYKNDRKGAQ